MKVKMLRIEQTTPDMGDIEERVNREIEKLKSHTILDVKMSVVRDAAPEYETQKSYAVTIMILYE